MGQYRIEISPNKRAGCKDTVCKKNNVKILKGEIRFGTWVEIEDHGSWGWKHWGCVSGAQVVGLQELCDSSGDGEYDFDAIDGFDELSEHPDIQEKIRHVVKQGHIDPEDFKGDPEKNKPGEKGIYLTLKQKEAMAKAAAEGSGEEAAPKKTKRGRKKADADEEEAEPQPKKAKKAKSAKASKKAEEDDKPITANTSRSRKPVSDSKSRPKSRSKAAVESELEDEVEEMGEETEELAARSGGGASGSKQPRAKVDSDDKEIEKGLAMRATTKAAKKSAGPIAQIKKKLVETEEEEEEVVKELDSRSGGKASGSKRSRAKAQMEKGTEADEVVCEEEPAPAKKGRKSGAATKGASKEKKETSANKGPYRHGVKEVKI